MDVVDEQIEAIGRTFLGMTLVVHGAMITSLIPSPQKTTTEWPEFFAAPKSSRPAMSAVT